MSRPTIGIAPAGNYVISWRDWNLVCLAGLFAYSTALGWMAQIVTYPLFRVVGADQFLTYHAAYNDAIPVVVILPGFATFLGGIAFVWTRPPDLPLWLASVVSVAGVVSLLSTVLWAIPRHDDLDRIGQSADTIDSLLESNAVRVTAVNIGTVAIHYGVARLLLGRGRGGGQEYHIKDP